MPAPTRSRVRWTIFVIVVTIGRLVRYRTQRRRGCIGSDDFRRVFSILSRGDFLRQRHPLPGLAGIDPPAARSHDNEPHHE